MGFKTIKSYNEDKFGGLFRLINDGDTADVIFLYEKEDDVLVADVHYIKSYDYSGYTHCCGRGCPACAKGIRTQTKLFIPLYNITTGSVEFFDRTMRFEPQLQADVFAKYPNPSDIVFRITRHGASGSVDTTYEIVAVGRNKDLPFAQLLADKGVTFPDYYENICKTFTAGELNNLLKSESSASASDGPMPNYQVTPRVTAPASAPPADITSLTENDDGEDADELEPVEF